MKKRVVIIEDQTAVREMLSQLVTNHPDFEVVAETGDGQEATQIVLDKKPDFVILDVMLPGLNGSEVLRRFSKHLKDVRVLVFSGYQNPTLVRELLQAGAHGFVEKSAPLSELQKGIEIVASGGSYFGPEVAQLLRDAGEHRAGVLLGVEQFEPADEVVIAPTGESFFFVRHLDQ